MTTTSDTSTNQLVINRLNQTQFDNATELESNEVYAVDPEFSGGKLLATDSSGDIVESAIASNTTIPTQASDINAVDLNASNLSNAGKNLIAGLGMPGDTYDDLTLLATDSSYTMPANGYLYLSTSCTANQNVGFYNTTANFGCWHQSGGGGYVDLFLPVSAGDTVKVFYSSGVTKRDFRFVYAKGGV